MEQSETVALRLSGACPQVLPRLTYSVSGSSPASGPPLRGQQNGLVQIARCCYGSGVPGGSAATGSANWSRPHFANDAVLHGIAFSTWRRMPPGVRKLVEAAG